MTAALLLDTHILVWLDSGDHRLRIETRTLIDQHYRGGGAILVSAVTAWEIAMLADGGKISLDCPPAEWLARCLGQPGFEEVPLSWRVCVRAYSMQQFLHRDPADRLLVATAIELSCPLVTYDMKIGRFASAHGQTCGLDLAS